MEDGTVSTTISTAWIPQQFAKKGKQLKMKIDGSWQYGWYVADVFATRTEEYVLKNERNYRKQREYSDV